MDRHRKETQIHCLLLPQGPIWCVPNRASSTTISQVQKSNLSK
jgi:hypothetical protein